MSKTCTPSDAEVLDAKKRLLEEGTHITMLETSNGCVAMVAYEFIGRKLVYLLDLYVDSRIRGGGIGTALEAEVTLAAQQQGVARMHLRVDVRNGYAYDWYHDILGYEEITTKNNYDDARGSLPREAHRYCQQAKGFHIQKGCAARTKPLKGKESTDPFSMNSPNMLAVVSLLAASEAFYTMPLKKRELPDRSTMERSLRLGYSALGEVDSIVINDYQDAQYYGEISVGTPPPSAPSLSAPSHP